MCDLLRLTAPIGGQLPSGDDERVFRFDAASAPTLPVSVSTDQVVVSWGRHRPDLAVVTAGANDMLRPAFDPALVRAELDAVVGPLADQGAVVVTFGLFDLSRAGLVAEPRREPFRRRIMELKRITREVTERYSGVRVDFSHHPAAEDHLLSSDRLHPQPPRPRPHRERRDPSTRALPVQRCG
jgi:hypothetical protein